MTPQPLKAYHQTMERAVLQQVERVLRRAGYATQGSRVDVKA
jgi:hypothetical protein